MKAAVQWVWVALMLVIGAGCGGAPAAALIPTRAPATGTLPPTWTQPAGAMMTPAPSETATLVAAAETLPATATQRVVSFAPVQGKPSLIQFYEEGCGPCVHMQGTVAELQAEYGERVSFSAAEITDPDAAGMVKQYRARGTPFLVLLGKDGQVAHRISGVVAAAELRQWLERLLK